MPVPSTPPQGQAEAPPPRPYGPADLLEATLVAPMRPWATFGAAAARPRPSAALLLLNAAVYAAAFLGLNLLQASMSFPGALESQPPARVAVVGALALVLVLGWLGAGAVVLHGAAKFCGGAGPFGRSFQAISMSAAVLPLHAAVYFWAPPAAPLAFVAWAVCAAAALETLHGAPKAAARVVCGLLAAASFGAGWASRAALERAAAPYVALHRSMRQLEAMSAKPMPFAPPPSDADSATTPPLAGGVPAVPSSGLDMLSAPEGGPRSEDLRRAMEAGRAAERAGADAVGGVLPMIEQAQRSPELSAEQRRQMQELTGMLKQLQGQMQSGQAMSPAQQQEFMRRLQRQLEAAKPPANQESR